MNRKQLLSGAAVCVIILWAVFAAGGVRLGSDAAPAPGTTAQTAGSVPAAQPLVAGAARQPANAGVAVQAQPAVAQGNLAAQPTVAPPTAVPATATPTAVAAPAGTDEDAETPEAGEAAETPEAAETAETPEAMEAAETPEPGEDADHDGDKVEQGATGGADSDNDGEDQDHDSADGQALAAQARITQQQAEQAALAANRGTTVVETELDEKDGTVLYKVKLSNGAKVKVNAVTGAILSTDPPESDDSND
ncbi:MAG TPA: PepSY domain-containing protein [Chloroflexia bacterium]|nr:PepSY domain-containing protein [Chloroflexia bacterium]